MTRRSAHRTQWAAQFAVASELCKQNHQVALTLGNHPAIDIMAISPGGVPFTINVKGLCKENYWAVSEKSPQLGLFYVFAYARDQGNNRFFVVSQQTVNQMVRDHLE